MHDSELLALIHRDERIADLLVRCDFDVSRVANGPVESVHLASGEPLEMIAGDAAGGAFMLAGTGDNRPVVYVGSEGSGGLIAHRLHDALALVAGLSSIHDAMAFPFDEDGGERLRAWLARADDEIREDDPEYDFYRTQLQEALGLPAADTLLESLQAAQRDETYRPLNEEGDAYDSMLHD